MLKHFLAQPKSFPPVMSSKLIAQCAVLLPAKVRLCLLAYPSQLTALHTCIPVARLAFSPWRAVLVLSQEEGGVGCQLLPSSPKEVCQAPLVTCGGWGERVARLRNTWRFAGRTWEGGQRTQWGTMLYSPPSKAPFSPGEQISAVWR